MEHRGVRYAIRIGIEEEQWRVAINLPSQRLPKERTVFGTRKEAETTVRSMIDAYPKSIRGAADRGEYRQVIGIVASKVIHVPVPMSAFGVKRTFVQVASMSAFDPKRT